jgi:iron(III) transport system ATP-binding protein
LSDAPLLTLNNIHCALGGQSILRGLGFSLDDGEIACLLGPSGCGKTTALRAIAGFIDPQTGDVALAGRSISQPGSVVPPERRGIGMVFQDYALFPHLSVADNISFGLARATADEKTAVVREMLELVGLSDKAQAYPHELSGGQQQLAKVSI